MIWALIGKIINRKTVLIVFICLFMIGFLLAILGTFRSDENLPVRIEIPTNSQFTTEINSFFNRTDATLLEDAQNKLIEDYTVRGYIIFPKTAPPPGGYPVIIWMHGFGASAELQINLPRLFAKNGFVAVAISQPGHGSSSGFWDMGIQALLGVYSTADWLVNSSPYQDQIDMNRIGVAGHSMGGIVTTRSGIFDNWTNPETGNPVGTGGLIRSYCAIYSWDDLYTMAANLIEEYLGIEDIWNNPTILRVLDSWRFLTNGDPSVIDEETRLRSVTNFINAQNIPNYCLITGQNDELTSPQAQCHIMANATKNASGIVQVSWGDIYNQVMSFSNHTWDYGDLTLGTARRLVLLPNLAHIQEGFDPRVAQNLLTWFNETMNCEGITTTVSANFNVPFFTKMIGWFMMLLGTTGCILPTISYLSTSKFKINHPPLHPKLPEKRKNLLLIYAITPVLAISLSSLITLPSLTHFWIFDLILPLFLLNGLFLLPLVITLVIFEARRYNFKIEDIGLTKSITNNLKAIAIPVIAIFLCVTLFDLICWFLQVPFLLPRPLDTTTRFDFLILFSILLLQFFCFELLFRGLFQTKMDRDKVRKLVKWKIVIKSGLFSGICTGVGVGMSILIKFGALLSKKPLIIMILFGGLILIYFLGGIVSAYIYQRTHNILSSTIFMALLIALFMAGKLLLTYA
ncbi:MAG: alpha/beta hydrolase family protein [Candidatus Helarchaeota archaeon]